MEVEYLCQPCYPELAAILAVGAVHVAAELKLSLSAARVVNGAAATGFLIYLAWRASRSTGVLFAWGMRVDNVGLALKNQLYFAAPAVALLITVYVVTGFRKIPRTFWLTLLVYPLWGVAQQFALQNLVARNLAELLPNDIVRALAAATLFAAAHYPRLQLVGLSFVAGFFFTMIYQRHPNLWAVGGMHGVLGALVMFVLLHEDPIARLQDIWKNRLPHG